MAEIGVIVTKTARIDRDAAVSLIKAFIEWADRADVDLTETVSTATGAFNVATEFTNRYANLPPEKVDS